MKKASTILIFLCLSIHLYAEAVNINLLNPISDPSILSIGINYEYSIFGSTYIYDDIIYSDLQAKKMLSKIMVDYPDLPQELKTMANNITLVSTVGNYALAASLITMLAGEILFFTSDISDPMYDLGYRLTMTGGVCTLMSLVPLAIIPQKTRQFTLLFNKEIL